MAKATLKLPRDPALRARMVTVVQGLSSKAKQAFYQEAEIWAQTADEGREVLGVLNRRYDLCVLECARPAPWFAAAFDTQTRELVVAQEFPNGQAISCPVCATVGAAALAEPVQDRECYPKRRIRT